MAVCRELTKRFEEVVRGTAAELAERFATAPKGEITLVLGPGARTRRRPPRRARAVAELVAAGTPRRVAADVVSRLTGTARNDALPRALCDNFVISFDNSERPPVPWTN